MVLLTPFSQGTHLLSVGRLIVVSDQAYHRCVISKFDDDVGAVWLYSRVCTGSTGACFNKEVQPTLSLNLNSELSYSEMGNSEFSVTEQLNCVSLLNSK